MLRPSLPELRHVLLVEDDPADVALIEDAFAVRGLPSRLHRVADGIEAMAYLRREPPYDDAPRPDLIVLDLNMPRMNGREVLAELKTDDRLRLIPVIVFTTSGVDSDIIASYDAHANAYVTKPLDLETFEQTVAAIHDFYAAVATLPPEAA